MIEFIKDVIIDFVLFSGIEGIIFCLFFTKVGDYKKFKFYQWFILAFVNCLISKIFPPVIYQGIVIIWMALFLYLFKFDKKILNCLKISGLSVAMFLVLEIIYSLLLEIIMNFEPLTLFLTDYEMLKLFILIIPLRIIEVINIFIVRRIKMKIIIGGVVRK